MAKPTPEELAILQKFCKHAIWDAKTSVDMLKPGEALPVSCANCGLKKDMPINWDAFLKDGNDFAYCPHCGGYIKKGEEHKYREPLKQCDYTYTYAHHKCEWGEDW